MVMVNQTINVQINVTLTQVVQCLFVSRTRFFKWFFLLLKIKLGKRLFGWLVWFGRMQLTDFRVKCYCLRQMVILLLF